MNDVSINDDLSDETKEAMAHYKTIALFGLDNRSNGSLSKGNSDVIMLANIDTKQHTINLVSVYRDSYLDTGSGTYQKCNAAYAKGGPEQALSMLNTNLDLAITDYVTVDFNAIIECVDLLGGVDITITDDEASLMIGYMKELNEELWKLGVTAKTQHNEVAPAQHELATIYTKANLAVDHNQIVMETMKKVANRHGMACLLHEKPFQGVNGSGKHNNWSLASDTGINMLDPGVTPHENIQFLLVLACIMKAVDRHADLLRQSAAVPGNDFRLGAQEAPPAIISIFVGEQLEDVIDQLISTGSATHSKTGGTLKTGVTTLPDFDKDATDRNRTSPFAFTGNKFEFRMVGSSDSVSSANVVLNTIVAEAFKEAADELEKAEDFDLAVHDMIKKLLADHRRIIFNGNGYSEAWVEEAEHRGLPNLKCMVDAIPSLVTEKAFKLFGDFGVYTKEELVARAEIEYESYAKSVNIEAKAMINIAGKQLIPAVVRYTTVLAQSLSAVKAACPEADNSVQTELLIEVSDLLSDMKVARAKLEDLVEEYQHIDSMERRAHFCYDEIIPAMQALRDPADQLEMIVDKEYWPIPSYGDMIFEV